ncbi:SDR family NAD(P)-dependent oxidoreductase [Methylobacterium isbiliense]|uniref:3-oxoacyl-[acyl-carrier-protein] reductase FabG n=1 Tax=Methylobacterium isbiliense TaxID=315478 RepID=A0ABQ4SMY2_9HYPH|nr:SDR family NAD(P)-dependent oxidoreductase [Methylobacterium isbiliense]MDN3623684.1 SDR family NAD(P)-dependent oxidoreductase [Methylobacterium isbiliense]GJE03108.1 3-oxoacyl-[acyl-carrier-protein] reductase FabG [Methylobacterium isbiliense]
MNLDLDGRVALLTGAARGIGLAEAEALAAEGCRIVVSDRDAEAAAEAAARLAEAGHPAWSLGCDVTDEAAVAAMLEAVAAREGRLDILVNNAGVAGTLVGHAVEAMSLDHWDRMVRIHMHGTFLCTRAAIPLMRAAGFGRIVNTSSMNVAGGGRPGNANYTAAKAGIAGFTRVVAKEVGRAGLTCNCVAPGYVETDLIQTFSADMRERITAQNPIGRFCKPEEVAALVAFLCSRQAAFINGAMINLDGGRREFVWD